jgi:hypothetical protein
MESSNVHLSFQLVIGIEYASRRDASNLFEHSDKLRLPLGILKSERVEPGTLLNQTGSNAALLLSLRNKTNVTLNVCGAIIDSFTFHHIKFDCISFWKCPQKSRTSIV